MNLRVASKSVAEGELPLGKQLANELKRYHNNHNTDEAKAPATGTAPLRQMYVHSWLTYVLTYIHTTNREY